MLEGGSVGLHAVVRVRAAGIVPMHSCGRSTRRTPGWRQPNRRRSAARHEKGVSAGAATIERARTAKSRCRAVAGAVLRKEGADSSPRAAAIIACKVCRHHRATRENHLSARHHRVPDACRLFRHTRILQSRLQFANEQQWLVSVFCRARATPAGIVRHVLASACVRASDRCQHNQNRVSPRAWLDARRQARARGLR